MRSSGIQTKTLSSVRLRKWNDKSTNRSERTQSVMPKPARAVGTSLTLFDNPKKATDYVHA